MKIKTLGKGLKGKFLLPPSRNKVSEANFSQRGHAEIDRVDVVPAFPLSKHDRANGDVDNHDPEACCRRNNHL